MIKRIIKKDWGIDLLFTVTDSDGTALDISAARGVSSIQLKVGRRGETTPLFTGTMSYVNTGTDGLVYYTISGSTVVDIAGYYDAEVIVNYTSGKRTVRPFTMQVLEGV